MDSFDRDDYPIFAVYRDESGLSVIVYTDPDGIIYKASLSDDFLQMLMQPTRTVDRPEEGIAPRAGRDRRRAA